MAAGRVVARQQAARGYATAVARVGGQQSYYRGALLGGAVLGAGASYYAMKDLAAKEQDYDAVRAAIVDILDDADWEDGSWGPIFVRLAWHASGTYSVFDGRGGSDGATMRFKPESEHGANAGLAHARNKLEAIKEQFPWISYADLWVLASVTAIEEAGGPKVAFTPGRVDHKDNSNMNLADSRLPDALREEDHIRAIFHRMGMSDQEIVALIGAHALGRCHVDRSGFTGPWTNSPTTFSNDFFVELLKTDWKVKNWKGPLQYERGDGLMMLPADIALKKDPEFRKWVEVYAKDEDRFFADFAAAYQKLTELGFAPKSSSSWWKFW